SFLDSGTSDQQPAFHGATGEIKDAGAWLLECTLRRFGWNANDELVAVNPDTHVSVDEKSDASEHLLLGEAGLPAEQLPDFGCESLTERHPDLRCASLSG